MKIEVLGAVPLGSDHILSEPALSFVGFLCAKFEGRRQQLLQQRKLTSIEYDSLQVPTFQNRPEVLADDWLCASVPPDVEDRRVEITGPVGRKMVINGLNSGANVYMADFEDSTSPTFKNVIEGQQNLKDAVDGTVTYVNPRDGKVYKLCDNPSTLFVRPRGWHLDEAHILVDGTPASGSIVDFALFFYHNVNTLLAKGTRPYFYLPKLETSLEARLWNDVFIAAQSYMGIQRGTIRATILLETITAAYEMEEILYEIRDHSLGLNCGRWDYLFSYIKKFKLHPDKVTPDRKHLTMETPLMQAYVKRLIYICHKRGTFAMGGMSAAIPIKNDPSANTKAMNKIKDDKTRECIAGHDGSWVAHPALVSLAKSVFNEHMKTPNQIHKPGLAGQNISENDLLQLPTVQYGSAITSEGLQKGVQIVLAYTEAWLRGIGCIPLNHHMEDAATAEISRAQIWQWRYHGIKTEDDGITITAERIRNIVMEEVEKNKNKGRWHLAGKLVTEMLTKSTHFDDFLTSVCYPYIVQIENVSVPSKL
jgi:malate synthase